jgi:cold shock CspA family protein
MVAKKIEQDINGEIVFFHDRKEYGFVGSEEHEDDFMFSEINMGDKVNGEEGERVLFDVMDDYNEEGEKRAVNIRKVE